MIRHSDLCKVLELAYYDMQKEFPDLPDSVIVVASGGRKAPTTYGHFAGHTWESEGEPVHEILIVAEHANRSAIDIYTTLRHEAVHARANKMGIKDVSGKRHNKRFRRLAEEMGMVAPEEADRTIGWSAVTLSAKTIEQNQKHIDAIEEQLKHFRKLKLETSEKKKTSWSAECGCGVKIRVGKKVYDGENLFLRIVCQDCGSNFLVDDEDNDA